MTGLYKHIANAWKKPSKEAMQPRLIEWRRSEAVTRVDKPLRLDKARMLGYKAKKGILVVRVRLIRGGRRRPMYTKGRKSTKQHIRKTLKMNYRWVAEIRAERAYPELRALNSYWIGKDGKHYYYEVILVDSSKPEIKSDRVLSWISSNKNTMRAQRGLTSAAKKSRGLRNRNPELRVRPSLRAWNRQGK